MPEKRLRARIGYLALYCFLGLVHAQEISPKLYENLKYRTIGPQGNRVIAVVGVPNDPMTCYAGAASGGIFKSTDGGVHWNPIFDRQPVASIGSLAIAPSDPNIIWAGTGETFIRGNVSQGMGIYKSTDAGKHWKMMGLKKTGRIGRVIIDPRNPKIVFAAAMGHLYGPQQDRGVFRSRDGGETWERVLFVDENTGCSDIVMDPNNPRILFAGMWPMLIRTWGRWSGGPGAGIYASRDGGTSWKRLSGHGLPKTPMGKIALAMSADNSERIYALIESKEGVLWRSDDGGEKWKLINRDHTLSQRPHYYSRLAAAPDDHNEVYFCATRFSRSLDGGESSKVVSTSPGGDNHDIWIDPKNPNRILVGNDGGIRISLNRGKSWQKPLLPIAQMYHVAVDNRIPYYVYGNRQDGSSMRGPSNTRSGSRIPSSMWHSVGGCECGFAVPDPVASNIVWSGCYEGLLDRYDLNNGQSRAVNVWPDDPLSWPAADVKFRFQWTFPIAISPHDHNRVYVGSQHLHRTTDGGQSWQVISPDLSTNDKSKQQQSGGITPDDASPTYGCTLFAISESPLKDGLIWAGTNDGQVQLTQDGGKHWSNVTSNIPGLPPWGTVSNIEPSRYDAGSCYITMDLHQVNNRDPFVYKTSDFGRSWKLLSSNIPRTELSYTHAIREDPVRKGLLYLGIENGVYVSFDDGSRWFPLQMNLPHVPVHWMVVQEHFNDLVLATYGRGFWILDDITPLRKISPDVLSSDAYLFPPRTAYRFRNVSQFSSHPDDQSAGKNPPYGASINYYLKSEAKSDIKLTIENENGETIRTYTSKVDPEEADQALGAGRRRRPSQRTLTKKAGINRIWWDLRYEPTGKIKLRTSPIGAPYVRVGKQGWRTLGPRVRLLAPPGVYIVKLTVDKKDMTEKLVVQKDPQSTGTVEDIQTQMKALLELRHLSNTVVGLINRIELIRKQIIDLNKLLESDKSAGDIILMGTELDKKLIEMEDPLIQMKLTGGTAGQDTLRWPAKLITKLATLATGIGQSDFPPTTQQIEVKELFQKQVSRHQERFRKLLRTDMATYNRTLKARQVPNIIISGTP